MGCKGRFTVEIVPSEAIFYSFEFFIERKEGDSSDARTKFEKLFSSEDKDKGVLLARAYKSL